MLEEKTFFNLQKDLKWVKIKGKALGAWLGIDTEETVKANYNLKKMVAFQNSPN